MSGGRQMAGSPAALLPLLLLGLELLPCSCGHQSALEDFSRPLGALVQDVLGEPIQTPFLPKVDFHAALTACHHSALADDPEEVSTCDVVEFLNGVAVQTQKWAGQEASSVPAQPLQVAREASGLAYQQLFIDYLEPRKAVVVVPAVDGAETDASEDSGQPQAVQDALAQCLAKASPGALETMLESVCPKLLEGSDSSEQLRVPTLLHNDYLLRTLGEQGEKGGPYPHPPALMQLLPDSEPTPLSAVCPAGMNGVLELAGGQIEFMAFDSNTQGAALAPHFASKAEELVEVTFKHQPSWDGDVASGSLSALGSLLVLPVGHVVSLRAAGSSSATLFKYCFVDASNFNRAKEATALRAHVDPETRGMSSFLASLLLDTTMQRVPPSAALPWAAHSSWPRNEAVSETASAKEDGSSTAPKTGRSRRGNRRSQKDWQAETRWKWRVIGLTLPTLSPPTILDVGRRNVTLGWLSGFLVKAGDSTAYGYNITWHRGHSREVAGWKQVSHEQVEVQHAYDDYHVHDLTYSLVDELEPDVSYTFRIMVYYGETSSPSSASSRIVHTPALSAPSRMESPPVLWRRPSKQDKGKLTGTKLSIVASPPVDDGGADVKGFIVQRRHVQEEMHDDWVTLGSFPIHWVDHVVSDDGATEHRLAFELDHLLPNCDYEFRIAAYNKIGVAAPGTGSRLRTNPVSRAGEEVVGGSGHRSMPLHHFRELDEDFHTDSAAEVREHLKALHSSTFFEVHGPVVTLSDLLQTVTLEKPGTGLTLPVWVSHWSPKAYKVTAEVIVTDPPMGDLSEPNKLPSTRTPLHNAATVQHRIALMERGGVPLVHKAALAQDAGALAVIVTDDGKCTEFDQLCCPGADKKFGDGFAKLDLAAPWEKIRIPVVLMLRADADKLLENISLVRGTSLSSEL